MSKGRIQVDGSFADCVAAANGRLDLVSFNRGHNESQSIMASTVEQKQNATNDNDVVSTHDTSALIPDAQTTTVSTAQTRKAEQQERKATGIVSKATFMHYARSMGGCWVATWILLLFALAQAASLACVAFVGRWSQRSYMQQVRIGLVKVHQYSCTFYVYTNSLIPYLLLFFITRR